MYHDDILACNQYVQACADNLRRALFFVLATIQQQLETVPVIVSDFDSLGAASRFAFGSKAKGIDYINANIATLYADAMAAKSDPVELLNVFLRVPGLGLVKGGFAAQIFANSVGCIDTHNITLYGIPLSALRYDNKLLDKTKAAKRARYVGLCDGLGGSASLWSRWCDYLAELRPNNWIDGAEVSRFHVEVITGIETGAIVDLFYGVDFDPKFTQAA
jgi:hypothetical protein